MARIIDALLRVVVEDGRISPHGRDGVGRTDHACRSAAGPSGHQ
jgi:hypothetical protein